MARAVSASEDRLNSTPSARRFHSKRDNNRRSIDGLAALSTD